MRSWGNCSAWGICFGENCWLWPGGWRFDLGSRFDRFCWPEGTGNVACHAGTPLKGWFWVLEDLSMQRAGRLRGGCNYRGHFQWLQRIKNNIWCVFHIALPFQLSQLIQSRIHSSFNILQKKKLDMTVRSWVDQLSILNKKYEAKWTVVDSKAWKDLEPKLISLARLVSSLPWTRKLLISKNLSLTF